MRKMRDWNDIWRENTWLEIYVMGMMMIEKIRDGKIRDG